MDNTEEKNDWFGQEVETKSDPMIDSGSGSAIILRTFDFEANPESFKKLKPTKQELFDSHSQQIKMFLWKDGLEPIDIIEPRIIISKKKDGYRIFIGCKAKDGVALMEKPQTLQELMNNNGPTTPRQNTE